MKLDLGYEVFIAALDNGKAGARLTEYGRRDESPEDAVVRATCWIRSQAQQSFGVCVRDTVHTYATEGSLYIDGTLVKRWTMATNQDKMDITAVDVSQDIVAPLVFIPRTSSVAAGDPSPTPGVISVKLVQGMPVFHREAKKPLICFSVPSASPEASQGIAHSIGIGAQRPAAVPGFEPLCQFIPLEGQYGKPIWFDFHYRSIDVLRVKGYCQPPKVTGQTGGETPASSRRTAPPGSSTSRTVSPSSPPWALFTDMRAPSPRTAPSTSTIPGSAVERPSTVRPPTLDAAARVTGVDGPTTPVEEHHVVGQTEIAEPGIETHSFVRWAESRILELRTGIEALERKKKQLQDEKEAIEEYKAACARGAQNRPVADREPMPEDEEEDHEDARLLEGELKDLQKIFEDVERKIGAKHEKLGLFRKILACKKEAAAPLPRKRRVPPDGEI